MQAYKFLEQVIESTKEQHLEKAAANNLKKSKRTSSEDNVN